MKWAMEEAEARELQMALRYLLLMLANTADHKGGNLYPSHGHLARRTGMGKSTVRAHILELERLGLLSKQLRKRQHDGSQTSNLYQLAMAQAGLDLEDDQAPPRARSQHGGGASSSAPPLLAVVSTRELGEVDVRTTKAPRGGKPPDEDFEAIWQALPKRAGNNPKRRAERAYRARRAAGTTAVEMLLGAERYARFCLATDKADTEFVMQAATFLGPERPFLQQWSAPSAAPAWWATPDLIMAKAQELGIPTRGETADSLKNRIRVHLGAQL